MNPKKILKNFLFLFSSNLVGQLFFLFGLAHLARVLGPASFGLWNLGQTWMLYLLRANEMGLEVVGIKTIARDPMNSSIVIKNVLIIRLILSVILMLSIFIIAKINIFPNGSETLIILFAFAVFPTAITMEWVFEANQRVFFVGVSRLLKGALFGLLVYFLIINPLQTYESAYIYLISLSIPSLLIFIIVYRKYISNTSSSDIIGCKALIKEAAPIGIATILSQYSLFIGTILISYLESKNSLGYFTAAHRLIIFVWAYGIVTSNRVILPQLSILFKESKENMTVFILKYFRLLSIISFFIGLIIFISGNNIIQYLYGETYHGSIIIIQILAFALIAAIVRSVFEIGLISTNRQYLFMHGMIGLAIVSTLFAFLFIINWGITGAAWAAVISEIAYAIYLIVVFKYISISDIVKMIRFPLIITMVIICILYFLNIQSLIFAILITSIIYPGFLIITGTIKKEDLTFLKKLFNNG